MKKYFRHLVLPALCTLTIALSTVFSPSGYAQNSQPASQKQKGFVFDPDRLVFGGNLGFQFGTVTILDISPIVGYKITDRFVAGVGVTYQYFEDRTYVQTFSTSVYGGRLFGRYYIFNNLFAHGEYEILNYDAGFSDPFVTSFNKRRITANNFLVGGGYVFPITENSGFNIMVLYNLNENAESLYSNPIIRLGFTIGI